MEKDKSLKTVFKSVNFVNRYKSISIKYQNFEERFENFSIEQAQEIINELGYKTRYNKSESFFKMFEKEEEYEFQFNISIKGGMVELIWDLKRNGQHLEINGPWGRICRSINDNEERIKLPVFRNYEDLKEILKDAFQIYEEFKKELIKQSSAL